MHNGSLERAQHARTHAHAQEVRHPMLFRRAAVPHLRAPNVHHFKTRVTRRLCPQPTAARTQTFNESKTFAQTQIILCFLS
jgi:hypothetical protein